MRRFDRRRKPRTAHARHILVKSKPQALTLLEEIQTAKRPFRSFKHLAKKHSTCTSARKGGDLGEFREGQMVQAFEDAVWATPPETVPTAFIKTQFGYHIVWVHSVTVPE